MTGPIPWLVIVGFVLSAALALFLRYNARFREFWQAHVCAFMEKHAHREDPVAAACPIAMDLAPERYLMGELTPEQREAFEVHMFTCAQCFESMKSGVGFPGRNQASRAT
jgi:hypothetical protein